MFKGCKTIYFSKHNQNFVELDFLGEELFMT